MATPTYIKDWMPTFCGLAGYKPEKDVKRDGINLASMLLKGAKLPERSLYVAGPDWRAGSLRLGDWNLVVTGKATE